MRRGFTLLEVIIATVIFAVVLAAAYGVFASGRRMVVTGEYHAGIYQTARAALLAIERDLKSANRSGSVYDTGLIGKNGGDEDYPQDEIEVMAFNRHTASQTEETVGIDLSRVSYFIDEEEGLMRRRITVLHKEIVGLDDEDEPVKIAENIVGLDIQYLGDSWQETWDSTRSSEFPKAIEVTVVVRGERGGKEELERFTTRFFLPLWQRPVEEPEEEEGQ